MSKKILSCRFRRPDAALRLICFPWAGGGAAFYSNWGKIFPEDIEVHGVCLAGREARYNEPVYSNLTAYIDDVTSAIKAECQGKPFAVLGHSMGALSTYEALCVLKTRYNMEPVHIFVSGISAPHSPSRKAKLVDVRKKTDDEFLEHLKKLGGTPADIIENRELMNIFLPALRADYVMLHEFSTDHPSTRCVLRCPLDVFDGKDDAPHELQAWQDITTGRYTETKLDGGHFYLKEAKNSDLLCKHICSALLDGH